MFDFTGKNVVITGGTRGIGRSLVDSFAGCNANVAYLYSSSDETASSIDLKWSESSVTVKGYKADVSDFKAVEVIAETILHDLGRVDILINNAGITMDSFFMMMPEDDWSKVININLSGVFNVTKQFVPHFIYNHFGKIINVASVGGIIGSSCQTNYSASKAGIIGFTKSLSKELAGIGINVNAVAPGYINTEMLDAIPEKLKKEYQKSIPAKRFGTVEEVVYPVMFLASEYSNYITGETIVIDGGLTA
jgi:3-oxoacyl-[acyl-carrier protein] reductase